MGVSFVEPLINGAWEQGGIGSFHDIHGYQTVQTEEKSQEVADEYQTY